MNKILKKFKNFEIHATELKREIGQNLHNVEIEHPEKVRCNDVITAINKFLQKEISKEVLLDWVNIIWFTDLFEYNKKEEDAIADVMTQLETLDEDVEFSVTDYEMMIETLSKK